MTWRTDGRALRDEQGRERQLLGINLVDKVPRREADGRFRPWRAEDLDDLARRGLDGARLGVLWSAACPGPGEVDTGYLGWLREQLDLLHERGMGVVLDAHQDLYSVLFGDGAPAWATLAREPFVPDELWSEAYLHPGPVADSLDAFWQDQQVDGIGLQQHFARFWTTVVEHVGDHPAVIGLDLLNEPVPGALSQQVMGRLLGSLAQLTGQDLDAVLAAYADPEQRFALLGRLEDAALHREVAASAVELLTEFERRDVTGLWELVGRAVREQGFAGVILREHGYFSNLGVPCPADPPRGIGDVVYGPHGYDLTVDTEATPLSSNRRVSTIFEAVAATQERWDVPVVVGEWGAFGRYRGVRDHGEHLLAEFGRRGWSSMYWTWEEEFAGTEAATLLDRPHARALAGTFLAQDEADGHWRLVYDGHPTEHGHEPAAPSLIRVPGGAEVRVLRDQQQVPDEDLLRRGDRLEVAPGPGRHEILVRRG